MIKYSDIGKFGVGVVEEEEAVAQSLDNIFSISPFEHVFSKVGCDLESLVFELEDDEFQFVVENMIRKCLEQEKRVVLNTVEVEVFRKDNGASISLFYEIRGLEGKHFYQFEVTQ